MVQLFTAAATLRQNRRQLDASALGTEVAALEKTISVLHTSLERQKTLYEEECGALRKRICQLEEHVESLQREISELISGGKGVRA